ncbi:hypothetical protein ZEAMMB73_Zm00001d019861 [Zea mays]|uniref:Uncharacterized protein n=1 Tax=Zea mays TaxID=4577 RepID=A0A1D6I0M1_MAIZE|nr:hypothetical protein ZEAMMB73_Zm00001d019861 [Zea mays]
MSPTLFSYQCSLSGRHAISSTGSRPSLLVLIVGPTSSSLRPPLPAMTDAPLSMQATRHHSRVWTTPVPASSILGESPRYFSTCFFTGRCALLIISVYVWIL